MLRRIARRLLRGQTRSRGSAAPAPTAESNIPHLAYGLDDEGDEVPPDDELEVTAADLSNWKAAEEPFQLWDIRESYELHAGVLSNSWRVPMNEIPGLVDSIPRDARLVIVCAAGVRSYSVTHYLREQGIEDSWSLEGGVAEWASEGFEFPDDAPLRVGQRVRFSSDNELSPARYVQSYSPDQDSYVVGSFENQRWLEQLVDSEKLTS